MVYDKAFDSTDAQDKEAWSKIRDNYKRVAVINQIWIGKIQKNIRLIEHEVTTSCMKKLEDFINIYHYLETFIFRMPDKINKSSNVWR